MYRLFASLVLLLLVGCSSLSTLEKDIVGVWHWQESDGSFTEKGFVKLNRNRTNSYQVVAINPTERVEMIKPEEDGYWYLSKEKNVCIATAWAGPTIILKANVKESMCYWYIRETESGNIQLVLKNNSVLDSEIIAVRR